MWEPHRDRGTRPAVDLDIDEFFRTGFSTDNALITEAVRRMLSAGGKRLRPRFTLLASEVTGGVAREHLALAAYMELIHVATLIHDDVVDGADTRRGVNATAVDFGNRISVLAGDYLFAWIFKNVTASYQPPIPHILSATLAEICDGEVLQLRALGDCDLDAARLRRGGGKEDRLAASPPRPNAARSWAAAPRPESPRCATSAPTTGSRSRWSTICWT